MDWWFTLLTWIQDFRKTIEFRINVFIFNSSPYTRVHLNQLLSRLIAKLLTIY